MIRFPIRDRRLLVLLGLAGSVVAGIARAEPSATERALARSLFEQGRALMAAGNYEQACPKLAESQRLDPAGGTLLNLALCHEKEGRTATAWSEYNDALSQARRDGREDRAKAAQERIAALAPLLSRLVLQLGPGADVPGLVVTLDTATIGKAAMGAPMPVDPGSHRLHVSAPGKKDWEVTFEIKPNADSKSVEIPALQDAPAGSSPPPAASSQAPAVSAPAPAAGDVPRPAQAKSRVPGYAVGAAGLVALGVGGYFGLRAFSKWDDSKAHCPAGACDAQAVSLRNEANTAAWVSNVAVGLGVVGLGMGTYLVLSPGEKEAGAPALGARSVRVLPVAGAKAAGVSVGGAW